jgi:hypothetical protein
VKRSKRFSENTMKLTAPFCVKEYTLPGKTGGLATVNDENPAEGNR